MIADNCASIRKRIAQAAERAGRNPDEVRIVAAAKTQPIDKIREAVSAGIRILAHNYVQEAAEHIEALASEDVEWHMIGHLQKNKAGKAVDLFRVIETVDDERLVEALQRRADAAGKTIDVLVQVNIAEEPQKSGVAQEDARALIESVRSQPNVRLRGLMTMPPFFDDPKRARPYFAALREMRDRFVDEGVLEPDARELSMGMTGDFEAAVEEGATLVRIGTALFGPRTR